MPLTKRASRTCEQAGRDLRRQPQVGAPAGERRCHHADDRILPAANRQRAPDRGGIAVESPRPEPIADHGGGRAVRRFFEVAERAARDRRRAEDREESRRDAPAVETLGLVAARVGHAVAITGREGHEAAIEPLPVLEASRGHEARPLAGNGTRFIHRDELIRVRIRQRLDEHRIHQRKHGRQDAGTEPERHDRGRGVRRPVEERSQRRPPDRRVQPRYALAASAVAIVRGGRERPAGTRSMHAPGRQQIPNLAEEQAAHRTRSARRRRLARRFERLDHLRAVRAANVARGQDQQAAMDGPSEPDESRAGAHDRLAGAGRMPRSCACRTSASSLAVSARRTARPSGVSR